MATTLFTGFPGFLGSELLPRVLASRPEEEAVCLVQPRFRELAASRLQGLTEEDPGLRGRVRLVEGDITEPDLGVAAVAELRREVTRVFHLAAVYDLEVSRRVGMRVNVDGTRHVLDLAEACPGFEHLYYVSTCYVSGRYAGIFGEEDLEKGQSFNNFYEETKYLAEVEVQERMARGLPATVYRPSIVVGDSRSGATQKYDGPYVVLQWLLRQPLIATVPVPGDPASVRVNLVPQDFVIAAMAHLSDLQESAGVVYQLADPAPLTVDELLNAFARATGRHIIRLPVPLGLAKASLRHLPGVQWLLRIPAASVDYFVHPTHYTTHNTDAALEGTGISVPPFDSYLDRLVAFYQAHPEVGAEGMA